eukprot:Skav233193  [mRNA]  locus=scaffold24:342881:347788:- [translate_table: standard]
MEGELTLLPFEAQATKAAELEIPLVADYGPGLRPEQLRRLLLSKEEQIDALKAVDHFLKSRCQTESGLFNLSDQGPTFRFASEFGAQSEPLQDILEMERDAEQERIERHWNQVQKQQEEAKALRKLIAELQGQLKVKEPQLQQVLELERWDVRDMIKVQDFRTSWADHFNMQKQYFNPPNKPRTIDVCLKLLSRAQAPSDRDVAGHHIDDLKDPRDGVKAEEKKMLDYLRGRVDAVVADKITEVLDFAKSSNHFITAGAAAALEHVPETLQWRQCGASPCFHAKDQQGRLYSINLLKGIVLLDGYPPRCIPESIVQHKLYKRHFGDAIFEVSLDRSGTFKTSRPVDGRFYEFQELSDGQLRITEVMEGCWDLAISNFIFMPLLLMQRT